jgi:tetratricopeptide (TPR) repeat protein
MELAYAHSNLGSMLRQTGDLEGALESFRKTLTLKRELVRSHPENRDWRFELSATHDLIGHTLKELGRLTAAQPHFEVSLALRRTLVEQEPTSYRFREFLGTSHDSLIGWSEARGLVGEALAHARASRQTFMGLTAHDPENQLWSWKLALSRMKEGHLLELQGQARESAVLLAAVRETATRRIEKEPTDRRWRELGAWVDVHLGTALAELSRFAPARLHTLRAVEALQELRTQEPKDREVAVWLAKALILRGRIERSLSEPRAAVATWEQARSVLQSAAHSSQDAEVLVPWASVLLLLGRTQEARPALAALEAAGCRPPDFFIRNRAAYLDAGLGAGPLGQGGI